MAKQKEAWDKLSMLEKALLIKLSVDNGVSSLKLIRDTYNLYANGGNLAHKKSGEELKESQGLNSSWLPDFAYNPGATQSQILNVLGITPMTALELYTAQEIVKEIDNPGYTQMKQNAQKAQMLKARHIVEENPGLLNMAESGIIDYLPVLGDAKLATEAAAAALLGDFTEAALLGMFTILPGATDKIASKALKNITKQDRDFIKAANLYFKKYGYESLDLNLADLGRSVVNLAIKDRINHLNTVSRGVYTIKDSFLNSILNLSVDDIVQISKNLGINFNDVKNAFELNKKLTDLGLSPTAENRLKYSLTHIPGHTGHGRAGLNTGELALYTSNSWGDINSVADRYSMPQWANPEIYEGAVGVLRRKFLLSPDNNRNKWFFEGDFPLLNRNNDVYPVLRYLKSHAEPNRKIEIDKDILNKVYEYVKDIQKLGRAKNKSIWNELNNTQSILKTRGFPYNIHIKNKFLLEAILDYLKNLDSPILNKKDISNIYNIIGKYKWVETPLFDKINTRQAIQLGYKKVYHDLKFVQSLLDLYFPNIWLLYVEFPIKTTEALKRALKGVNRTLHFIFTGIPGEEPVELLEYIPTNYNKNLSHGHNSNTTPGTRKTFSTGGPLYPFSFEKNPFLKTPVVRYDEGGNKLDALNPGGYTDEQLNKNYLIWKTYDPTGGLNFINYLMSLGFGNLARGEENEYWKEYLGLDSAVPLMNSNAHTEWDKQIEALKKQNGELASDFYGTTPRMDYNILALADTLMLGNMVRNYEEYDKKYNLPHIETVTEAYEQAKNILNNPNKWTLVDGEIPIGLYKYDPETSETNPLGMLANFGMKWVPEENALYMHDTYDFPSRVHKRTEIPVRPREMKIRSKISFDPTKGSWLLRSPVNYNTEIPAKVTK